METQHFFFRCRCSHNWVLNPFTDDVIAVAIAACKQFHRLLCNPFLSWGKKSIAAATTNPLHINTCDGKIHFVVAVVVAVWASLNGKNFFWNIRQIYQMFQFTKSRVAARLEWRNVEMRCERNGLVLNEFNASLPTLHRIQLKFNTNQWGLFQTHSI